MSVKNLKGRVSMKAFYPAAVLLAFLAFDTAAAQSYVGHSLDNYSGLHGLLVNPAAVVDTRQRADINLLSVSAFGGSDYFSTDLSAVLKSDEGFSFDEATQLQVKDENQFFLNVDVLGPSVMFNLTPSSSLGLSTRIRGFMNLNNVNGKLYESLEEGFDLGEDLDFEMRNFSETLHAWGEVGVTYGHVLMDGNRHFLKGGITLKYLQGAGATFASTGDLSGQYSAATSSLTATGSLQYGNTPGFDSDDINFEDPKAGFGADLGLIYEFRNDRLPEAPLRHSEYRFRLGLSITDIGSITYDGSSSSTYVTDGVTIDTERFGEEDLETILREEYEYTEETGDIKISLPTALHLVLDYNFGNRFYTSLHGAVSLVGASTQHASRIINTLTATPRYEARWFSVYLPMSIRQYDGVAMGAGLRLGPLSIGSGSIITNYISDESQTADIYVGLKIPIYR